MAIDVIMPKLGESITEATILEWKKNVGDVVGRDETILEISTDKVDSEVPSPASGTLLEILFKKNDTVPVGEVIARIGDEGEKLTSSTSKPETKKENKEPDDVVIDKTPKKAEVKVEKEKFSNADRFYSPLVRSIAKKENISLEQLDNIKGSGYNGRVNKTDILNFINSQDSSVLKTDGDILESKESFLENKIEPMDHVRKMIAQHMIKSRDTSVHVYSSNEIDRIARVGFELANSRQKRIC